MDEKKVSKRHISESSSVDNSEDVCTKASIEDDINIITKGSRPLLILTSIFLITFLVWANWCSLDEVARGDGRVTPSSQVQNIQNLEGGIVEDILVAEGDVVDKDQVLIVMDDTRFSSLKKGQVVNKHTLEAKKARLIAEVEGGEPLFSEDLINEVPDLVTVFHHPYQE
ncbi:biotin/lipoyl-binding protein [Endozoicomonas atrinae]|uniref:biotin/lipoyl-binding protein n=1 Tax=Endozoicomonas atrinae TaxID=1333660 RepID=UPI003B00546C